MGRYITKYNVSVACTSIDVKCPKCKEEINFLDFSPHIWDRHMESHKRQLPANTCGHCLFDKQVKHEGGKEIVTNEHEHLDKATISRNPKTNVIEPARPTCGQCPIYFHEKSRIYDVLSQLENSTKGCRLYACTSCKIYYVCYRDYLEHIERNHRTQCVCHLCCVEIKPYFEGKDKTEWIVNGFLATDPLLKGKGAEQLFKRVSDHLVEHINNRYNGQCLCCECKMGFANNQHCYRHILQVHQPQSFIVDHCDVCPQCTTVIENDDTIREHLEGDKCKYRDIYPAMRVTDNFPELKVDTFYPIVDLPDICQIEKVPQKKRTNEYEVRCTVCEEDVKSRKCLADHFIECHELKDVEQALDGANVEFIGRNQYEPEFDRLQLVDKDYYQKLDAARQLYPETKRDVKIKRKRNRSPINLIYMERTKTGKLVREKEVREKFEHEVVRIKNARVKRRVEEKEDWDVESAEDDDAPVEEEVVNWSQLVLDLAEATKRIAEEHSGGSERVEETDDSDVESDEDDEVEVVNEVIMDLAKATKQQTAQHSGTSAPVTAKPMNRRSSWHSNTRQPPSPDQSTGVLDTAVPKLSRTRSGKAQAARKSSIEAKALVQTESKNPINKKRPATDNQVTEQLAAVDSTLPNMSRSKRRRSANGNVPSVVTEQSVEREVDLGSPNTSISSNGAALNRQGQASEVAKRSRRTNDARVEQKLLNEEVALSMPGEPLNEEHAGAEGKLTTTIVKADDDQMAEVVLKVPQGRRTSPRINTTSNNSNNQCSPSTSKADLEHEVPSTNDNLSAATVVQDVTSTITEYAVVADRKVQLIPDSSMQAASHRNVPSPITEQQQQL